MFSSVCLNFDLSKQIYDSFLNFTSSSIVSGIEVKVIIRTKFTNFPVSNSSTRHKNELQCHLDIHKSMSGWYDFEI